MRRYFRLTILDAVVEAFREEKFISTPRQEQDFIPDSSTVSNVGQTDQNRAILGWEPLTK